MQIQKTSSVVSYHHTSEAINSMMTMLDLKFKCSCLNTSIKFGFKWGSIKLNTVLTVYFEEKMIEKRKIIVETMVPHNPLFITSNEIEIYVDGFAATSKMGPYPPKISRSPTHNLTDEDMTEIVMITKVLGERILNYNQDFEKFPFVKHPPHHQHVPDFIEFIKHCDSKEPSSQDLAHADTQPSSQDNNFVLQTQMVEC